MINFGCKKKNEATFSLFLLACYFRIWGISSAGSPRHSETHPAKNLINKLFDVRPYGGVAQLGERLNGIQEVKSSILSVSTKSLETLSVSRLFSVFPKYV